MTPTVTEMIRELEAGAPGFPPRLRELEDTPEQLYLRGTAPDGLLSLPTVAIVGARACSAYGASVARQLGEALAMADLVVVSGLARGIDREAHLGALGVSKGKTVAVLGCGIDRDYPAANAHLAHEIALSGYGLIVSEYEPGVEPAPWRFPARNRIIAGLANVTVVVEARERSGSMITADFAMANRRMVWSVPGEITSSLSVGTNSLLDSYDEEGELQVRPLVSIPKFVEEMRQSLR